MRTALGFAVLTTAIAMGGVILASASGGTIADLITRYEQDKMERKTIQANEGVRRFAEPRLYEAFTNNSR